MKENRAGELEVNGSDPEDPFRAPTLRQAEQPQRISQFTVQQIVSFGALVAFSVAAVFLWKFEFFGATPFPWFIIAIGTFLCVWAVYYWLSKIFDDQTPPELIQKYYFWLHCSIYVIVCGVVSVMAWLMTPFATLAFCTWWVYVIAPLSIFLAIHFTWLWTPEKWRWFTVQLFIYLITVGSAFVLWYFNRQLVQWWEYIATIYGGILFLQVVIYFLVTKFHVYISVKPVRAKQTKDKKNDKTKPNKSTPLLIGTVGHNTFPPRKMPKNPPSRKSRSMSEEIYTRIGAYPGDIVPSRDIKINYAGIRDHGKTAVQTTDPTLEPYDDDLCDVILIEPDDSPEPANRSKYTENLKKITAVFGNTYEFMKPAGRKLETSAGHETSRGSRKKREEEKRMELEKEKGKKVIKQLEVQLTKTFDQKKQQQQQQLIQEQDVEVLRLSRDSHSGSFEALGLGVPLKQLRSNDGEKDKKNTKHNNRNIPNYFNPIKQPFNANTSPVGSPVYNIEVYNTGSLNDKELPKISQIHIT